MAFFANTGDAGSWKTPFATGNGAAAMAPAFWVRPVDSEVVVGSGGEKAGTESELAGDKSKSTPQLGDRVLEEVTTPKAINWLPQVEAPRGCRKKVVAKRPRQQVQPIEFQIQDDRDQDVNLLDKENEKLRLKIALKTKELLLEQNRRLQLKLDFILKIKENETLLKQNEELKAKIEELQKTEKPSRWKRRCSYCKELATI